MTVGRSPADVIRVAESTAPLPRRCPWNGEPEGEAQGVHAKHGNVRLAELPDVVVPESCVRLDEYCGTGLMGSDDGKYLALALPDNAHQ